MHNNLGLASACAAVLLSACAAPSAPAPATTPPVKIANPASVYCIQQSGKLRMQATGQGERALCILPNGQEVDEWVYFRQNHPGTRQ